MACPPGSSMTLWDIPALSLLGRGEVQTRKPSFERSLDHLLPSAWFKTPSPIKAFVSLNTSNYRVRGKRGTQVGAGDNLAGFFRLRRTPA